MSTDNLDHLLAEADAQPFAGWDFSALQGRMGEGNTSWRYADLIRPWLSATPAVLDLGTGGGEVLASMQPLPPRTVATEGHPPNVEVARARLTPLGVEVVPVEGAPGNIDILAGEGIGTLPFADGAFPLVINRHESYYPAELHRVLSAGGRFCTQQVGATHLTGLNRLLGSDAPHFPGWNLDFAVRQLQEAGFQIRDAREEFPHTVFEDVGAVAYYLKAVPWKIPDFSIPKYHSQLATLHQHVLREGPLRVSGHVFYIEGLAE